MLVYLNSVTAPAEEAQRAWREFEKRMAEDAKMAAKGFGKDLEKFSTCLRDLAAVPLGSPKALRLLKRYNEMAETYGAQPLTELENGLAKYHVLRRTERAAPRQFKARLLQRGLLQRGRPPRAADLKKLRKNEEVVTFLFTNYDGFSKRAQARHRWHKHFDKKFRRP
jgi:hypothetical protein